MIIESSGVKIAHINPWREYSGGEVDEILKEDQVEFVENYPSFGGK